MNLLIVTRLNGEENLRMFAELLNRKKRFRVRITTWPPWGAEKSMFEDEGGDALFCNEQTRFRLKVPRNRHGASSIHCASPHVSPKKIEQNCTHCDQRPVTVAVPSQ